MNKEITPKQIYQAINDLLKEKEDLQQRIDKAINILKELRLLTPMEYGREEQIDLLLEILGVKNGKI